MNGVAAGHGPDGHRLVSLSADARSAKGWHLGPPPVDGESVDDPVTRVRAGYSSGRPVVVVQDADGARLLDGASGAVLDRTEERDGGPAVDVHPGAPVLRRDRPGKRKRKWKRQPVGVRFRASGPPIPFPETRGLVGAFPVPGTGAPRFVACIAPNERGNRYLAMYTADSRVKDLLDARLTDVRSVSNAQILWIGPGRTCLPG